jgi:hypothetical protein
MRWAEQVARIGEMKNANTVLAEIPEGKRPLGSRGRRREDNIKMDLREVRWRLWVEFMRLKIGADGGR